MYVASQDSDMSDAFEPGSEQVVADTLCPFPLNVALLCRLPTSELFVKVFRF
jgi:hypothetical protein